MTIEPIWCHFNADDITDGDTARLRDGAVPFTVATVVDRGAAVLIHTTAGRAFKLSADRVVQIDIAD